MQTRTIAVIGSGAWGMALARLYCSKSIVTVLTRKIVKRTDNLNIALTSKIDDLIDQDIVFIVIPSQKVRVLCQQLVGKIKRTANIIICSKGIEQHSNYLMSEVVEKFFPNNCIAVLTGPNFASELDKALPAISTIANKDLEIAQNLATELSVENFKLYPCKDVIGVQICGALKNVLAIVCGIATGFNLGENFKAALLTNGIKEISKLVAAKGGNVSSLFEPGGIGDIILTCNSHQSRNMSLGLKIAQKERFEMTMVDRNIEGVYSVISLQQIIQKLDLELPIFDFVCNVISEQSNVSAQEIKHII